MTIITIHKAVKREEPKETIEFIQFDNLDDAGAIERWTSLKARYDDSQHKDLIYMRTDEDLKVIGRGDYIVKDKNGVFYPYKRNAFNVTYDILPKTIKADYNLP